MEEDVEDGTDAGTAGAPKVPGYEVLGPLGQGASATVWRARRRGDGLVVALKVLRPAGGDVAAGLREAGLLAGVRHRHVVRLYDVLPLPDPATGRPAALALATQLAGGGSLAQVLARRRILSPGELVTALQPVAGALADLHDQGVVHGDLSTGNVLFLRDGMPLLADLGAARVSGAPAGEAQGTGVLSGLVAPEVVEGFPATQESDVYQLGAIAWLCLAGEPPGPPWSRGRLEELAPGLPGGLTDLVTRCLAPEPADRPDAEEIALALLATATPEPVEVAPDADPGHGLTERLRQQAREDLGQEPERSTRERWRPLRWQPRRRGTHRPERVRRRVVAESGEGPSAGPGPTRFVIASMIALALAVGGVAIAKVIGADVVDVVRGDAQSRADGPAPPSSSPVPGAAGRTEEETGSAAAGAGEGDTGTGAPAVPDGEVGDGHRDGDGEAADAVARDLQQLVDGRAQAWRAGDAALLSSVLADGSPALESETEALMSALDQEVHYLDLGFRVQDVSVRHEEEGRLTVDAVVARDPLHGVRTDGTTVVDEPARTDAIRVVLARDDDTQPWRLWSWGPA